MMTRHIKYDHDKNEYTLKEMVEHGCRICGEMCRNKRGLSEHKRSKHGTTVSPTGGFSPGASKDNTV